MQSLKRSEHSEQVALFEWIKIIEKQDIRFKYIFAVPNGGLRDIRVAAKLKKEGVRSGVLDICWNLKSGGYSGLFIEMKNPNRKNGLSPNQKEFKSWVESQGYKAVVCYTSEEAIKEILNYSHEKG